ncbi:FAD binding domain-containing protein [Colletotrichum lupini]|uniref:FAD binding domain-containing protein n=1 Tax=Colletotrichum lupini TaxID=145971 RepID=A0A9Q8SYB6_9PEZI|nr:FAD binding domain-containing protein [Colletotrichum lupini]UQC84872.1 FAD binding domain-containing protein [Colletotrichum lupini]
MSRYPSSVAVTYTEPSITHAPPSPLPPPSSSPLRTICLRIVTFSGSVAALALANMIEMLNNMDYTLLEAYPSTAPQMEKSAAGAYVPQGMSQSPSICKKRDVTSSRIVAVVSTQRM